ncbi:hypothetical protein WMY93_015625 [Mugilogobius chulae]|uniref:G-protein coupled receptors family 1 profile domain-containing protein n=1 Tax=Mugilogobius chulae TaxID=88201 RepID=A0AAW0P2U8_9GOBI
MVKAVQSARAGKGVGSDDSARDQSALRTALSSDPTPLPARADCTALTILNTTILNSDSPLLGSGSKSSHRYSRQQMEDDEKPPVSNWTQPSSSEYLCKTSVEFKAVIGFLDLLSVLLGQPMTVRLLWITLTYKQLDILNANLALFHNVLYCMIYVHLYFILFSPLMPVWVAKFTYKVGKALRNSPVGKNALHPAKRRAFVATCVTSASAMTFYIPVMITDKVKNQDEKWYNCRLAPMCTFILSLATLVHPLFYLYTKGELRCRRGAKKSG